MFAAFHLPDLPVTAALRSQPEWRGRPCSILGEATGRDDGKIQLLSLNKAAQGTGISAGWPLNRALVRCPDLRLLQRDPPAETALLTEIFSLAESFTPDVEITSPDTVLLDLSLSPVAAYNPRWLFEEFMQRSQTSATSLCEISLAATPDLAHFAVLEPSTRGRFISIEEIGTLPLKQLERMNNHAGLLSLLELLGMSTVANYRRLPRQQLVERFGPLAGHWHDVISGKTCRLLKLHRPPESFLQTFDLDDAIVSSESLVFIFNRLLHVLSARLAARHLAASILDIRLRLEEGEMQRKIHLPEPLADPIALLKPIQTLIASLVLPSPVVGIELDATSTFPLSRQSDWTKRQLPNPERWADTLAQLEALAGSGNVGIPLPLKLYRPDAFEMKDATGNGQTSENGRLPDCNIPLRRFRPPLQISVAFEALPEIHPRPLALLTGPHCGQVLESRGPFPASGHYWDPAEEWKRAEWDIRVENGPLLRLVHQPGDHWQLDGAYV